MFSQKTFQFLDDLGKNNHRDWFNDHKNDYEQQVRAPALDFITQMQPLLAEISTRFLATPKKVGGSLMRVYRDTRFGKDKTPYKTNIGIQFRHFMGKDVHAPAFYVHISAQSCFIGAGIWRPDGPSLNKIRHFIDDNPRGWSKAIKQADFAEGFYLSGDSLKRPPRGFSAEHELIDDLKRKDFIAIMDISPKQVLDDNFALFCAQQFKKSDAFMYYLCTALDLPYQS